jgi:predicted  nucleic acid-binding Zn-ribbon protein
MTRPGFRLRHLSFLGPEREVAHLPFGPGLNVIYGASETGKSFLVEAIDFMLGGKPPLRDIPERVGYDRILLGIETIQGALFTLRRSTDGGRFRLYDGLHEIEPAEGSEFRELAEQHSDRNNENLSSFLLDICDLSSKRIRRNKRGDTNSLSFRNLARLVIVTETEITDQRSPLSDGNPTTDTANFATFKLLLTGVDDSSLVSAGTKSPEEQGRDAQGELLDQMIEDYEARLKSITKYPRDLREQLARLESSIEQQELQLNTSEAQFRALSARRRSLREKIEIGTDRRVEIAELVDRFNLLHNHYESDISRLQGIQEAGAMFTALGQAPCPLCGSPHESHRRADDCEGDVEAIVAASASEIAKIHLLQEELTATVASLQKEAASYDRQIPRLNVQLTNISQEIETLLSPQLNRMRASYTELSHKRGEVREALSLSITLDDIKKRRIALEPTELEGGQQGSAIADADLPTSISDKFSVQIEDLLRDWHFPNAQRVHFDSKAKDLIISGKLRTARGKGHRAITHAAFTIGLLEYCRIQDTPHPGLVVLDSPLLAYRAPEGEEDDLSGTGLSQKFYEHLIAMSSNKQVIIVENVTPPDNVTSLPQTTFFTRNQNSGRYGFFPHRSR